MRKRRCLLALVFVIRYFSPSGELVGATIGYNYSPEECMSQMARVEKQEDPPGTTTKLDCIEESALEFLLSPGGRT